MSKLQSSSVHDMWVNTDSNKWHELPSWFMISVVVSSEKSNYLGHIYRQWDPLINSLNNCRFLSLCQGHKEVMQTTKSYLFADDNGTIMTKNNLIWRKWWGHHYVYSWFSSKRWKLFHDELLRANLYEPECTTVFNRWQRLVWLHFRHQSDIYSFPFGQTFQFY